MTPGTTTLTNTGSLDGLHLSIEGLDLAVGQAELEMPQDAGEVVADGGTEFHEGGQPAVPRPADPAHEQGLCRGAIRRRFVDAA